MRNGSVMHTEHSIFNELHHCLFGVGIFAFPTFDIGAQLVVAYDDGVPSSVCSPSFLTNIHILWQHFAGRMRTAPTKLPVVSSRVR
jgi:hypothetical protein